MVIVKVQQVSPLLMLSLICLSVKFAVVTKTISLQLMQNHMWYFVTVHNFINLIKEESSARAASR